eukprot:GAFH01001033.1.p1 GENE.GAFH01001033.1~~GAFH01001033.1.p1  ORF type:complete len:647 (+),score=191.04 GAFH01001033.1:175-1941(+)
MICELYYGHKSPTSVAKWSPNENWICSADSTGHVLVWDMVNTEEHILRLTRNACGNGVFDLAWSDDSQRICVCGAGKERSVEVFFADNGAAVGDMMGHVGTVLSCSFRQQRPYRVATGGEDRHVNFYKGPPFQLDQSDATHHSNFVNQVEFSPDNALLVSVGSDRKGFLYNGKTFEYVSALSDQNAHTGAIMGVAWSPDSHRLLTASTDKTAKIWDAATGACVQTFVMAPKPEVNDQQLGCLWSRDILMTVNLRGELTYLDERSPQPTRVIRGHNAPVTSIAVHQPSNTFFTSDSAGRLLSWDVNEGCRGAALPNPINTCAVACSRDAETLCSTLRDGKVVVKPVRAVPDAPLPEPIALPESSQTVCDPATGNFLVMGEAAIVVVSPAGQQIAALPTAYRPTCLSVGAESHIAVGGSDQFLHMLIWNPENNTLGEVGTVQSPIHKGRITACAMSPNGQRIAYSVGTTILLYFWADRQLEFDTWLYHVGEISTMAWSPDGAHLATGGHEPNILVWYAGERYTRLRICADNLFVTDVAWVNDTDVMTVGSDMTPKLWRIDFSVPPAQTPASSPAPSRTPTSVAPTPSPAL